jgi:hypothetical protein
MFSNEGLGVQGLIGGQQTFSYYVKRPNIFFFKFAFYGLDMELEPEPEP